MRTTAQVSCCTSPSQNFCPLSSCSLNCSQLASLSLLAFPSHSETYLSLLFCEARLPAMWLLVCSVADLQAGLTQQQGSFLPFLLFSFLAAQDLKFAHTEIFLFSSNKTVLGLGFKFILNSFITKLRIPKGTLAFPLNRGQ